MTTTTEHTAPISRTEPATEPAHTKRPSPITKWLCALEQGSKPVYWLTYTILFILMFALMGLFLFTQGKGFIWLDDGLTQQYTSFVQLGDFYRQLGAALGGTADFPMFSPAVGYGNDMLLALISYIANPLYMIAAIATPQTADVLLNSTVPITLFLAGVFFTLFARNHSSNGFAILVGCMVFVFSGFTLTTFYQIHMMFPLMLCPLIFLGAELIFQHRSPILFPVALAFLMANALDAAYDCCILLFIYCLVRFFTLKEKRTLRSFFVWFGKFFGLIVLAACISAILFLPTAYSILSQNRLELNRDSDLIYPLRYYYRLVTGFIGFSRIGSESFYGVFPIAAVALTALVFMPKGRQRTALLIMFAAVCVILLFPFFGRLMNGFAYPNNRWSWAFSLLMGYITLMALPYVIHAPKRARKRIFVILAIAVVVGLGIVFVTNSLKPNPPFLCALIVLALLAICVVALHKWKTALRVIVMLSLLLSCGSTYWLWGSTLDIPAMENHELFANSYNDMVSSSANKVAESIDRLDALQNGYRYDTISGADIWRNASIPLGHNGVSFYNSIYNDAIDELHTELGLTTSPFNISFSSLDSRLVLEQLAGAKYLIVPGEVADAVLDGEGANGEGFGCLPAGYAKEVSRVAIGNKTFSLLEAEETLPLAFVYDQACSQDSLASFPPVQKQDALALEMAIDGEAPANGEGSGGAASGAGEAAALGGGAISLAGEAAALAGGAASPVSGSTAFSDSAELEKLCQNISYTAELTCADVSPTSYLDGESFVVPSGGADLRITCDIKAGKRAYLQLENVQFTENRSLLSTENKTDGFLLNISCGEFGSLVTQITPESSLYGGKDTWAANLGVAQSARSEIVVHFSTPGTYSIGKLLVTLEDEVAVLDKLKELGEHAADNVAFEGNTLTCSTSIPEGADGESDSRYLFVRLPYSEGWHASLDGAEAHVIKANYGFVALKLPSGEHAIELTYETPFLKIGAALSCIGIVALIVLGIAYKRAARHT